MIMLWCGSSLLIPRFKLAPRTACSTLVLPGFGHQRDDRVDVVVLHHAGFGEDNPIPGRSGQGSAVTANVCPVPQGDAAVGCCQHRWSGTAVPFLGYG